MAKMQLIGKINSTNRKVYYIDSSKKGWWGNLPEKNWVGMIFSGNSKKIKKTVVKYSLNKNISHVTVVGQYAKGLELNFDFEIVGRKIDSGEYPNNDNAFEECPCTTSNEEFKEGFWYCCYSAFGIGNETIEDVVCIDCNGKMQSNILKALIKKFNAGYMPGVISELEKYEEEGVPILHQLCEFNKGNCCRELSPKALIPMSLNNGKNLKRVFKYLKYKLKDKWWIHLVQCKKCKQYWLMAQEERIHDNWFLEKINNREFEKIKDLNLWPESILFSFYYLVHSAKKQGKEAVLFYNPEDWKDTIYDTVKIIMNERDKIDIRELSKILNYDYKYMKEIALEYVKNEEYVVIQNNHIMKKYLI